MLSANALAAERSTKAEGTGWSDEPIPDKTLEEDDDTPNVETDTTLDITEERKGLKLDGDLRPIFDYYKLSDRDGFEESAETVGFRLRARADWGLTENVHIGARIAGRCFFDTLTGIIADNPAEPNSNCDLEFVMEQASPAVNGLEGGQFTFDELYLHWFRTEQGAFALGRLQTRFVLRGGVYAKSLDRNDSNNVNVTWTDGVQGSYHAENGWHSNFIVQRNAADGTGSIRRGQLDFDDSEARNTYFLGFENTRSWGRVVQRALDVSYLPASMLKDGDKTGRREDYWGVVGRFAYSWPRRREGTRLRAGLEMGYAPNVPTSEGAGLDENVSGLAWDVVASIMDFMPGHNIGINYARTGAGWFLSPQFRSNEELFEIRYQWRPENFPLFEWRVRWREDLIKPADAMRKREVFDMYLRLTWEF
jgi:hypothetical protein